MYTPREIQAVNRTARSAGAVGPNAVVPKFVRKYICKADLILDYGAGPEARHTMALRDEGYTCIAYDIGDNFVEGVHDPLAMSRQYDVVFASNVLNVSISRDMFRRTLNEITDSTDKNGILILNYPREPRYCQYIGRPGLKRRLKLRFDVVTLIQKDINNPVFLCSKPKRYSGELDYGASVLCAG